MTQTVLSAATQVIPNLFRHPAWAPLNDRGAWQRLTTALNPLWTLGEVRARVVGNIVEAPGVHSLWLKPNRHFRGFKPGQHVMLELDVTGARHSRCFSLSAAPRRDGLLRLTIKRKESGLISSAAQQLRPGQTVGLSQASGEFAPRDAGAPLLMISAGSGITPMLSILDGLAMSESNTNLVLIHSARHQADLIGADELQTRRGQLPQLQIHSHLSADAGRFDPLDLPRLVPDWHQRDALLCGPDGFMQAIESFYADTGSSAKLTTESFGRRAAPIDANADRHTITSEISEHMFTARSGQSLLEAAEVAGLKPRFGCRRGICMSCQCRKRSGTVKNLLTGQLSSPGDELIQLCISTPQSAVELAL